MRDWHHDIIRLDQALVIVNAIPVAQHNRVIVGVAELGFFEFKFLATPANELNYVAVNEGLSKTVSPNREKSSLIRMSSAKVVPQLGATKADYDTAKDSHATRVVGIIVFSLSHDNNETLAHEVFHSLGFAHSFDKLDKESKYVYKAWQTDCLMDYLHKAIPAKNRRSTFHWRWLLARKMQKIMQENKRHIIFVLLALTVLGCSSVNENKFKPLKDKYENFFGIKLPVLSDNKKQFIVTNK